MTLLLRLLALCFLLALSAPHARAQTTVPPWQMAAGSTGATRTYETGTAVDAAGNLFLVGYFEGTAQFGNTTLTSAGRLDIYVAKWSPSTARFEWAVQAGGTDDDQVNAVAVGPGGIYVAGRYKSGVAAFGGQVLTGPGTYGMFVAKLTDQGSTATWNWARQPSGGTFHNAAAIAVDGANVYVSGSFTGSPTFDATTLTGGPSANVFVARITDSGPAAFTWATSVSASGTVTVYDMAVSGSSVYLTGYFTSSALRIGTSTLTTTAGNLSDAFVAKLADQGSTGAFVWGQQGGTPTDLDVAYGIAASGPNVYITGYFRSSGAVFGNTTLANQGYFDIFVAKLVDAGSTGSFAWALSAGGSSNGSDRADAIAVSGSNVYITGEIGSPVASFGSVSVTGSPTLRNMYLAKLVDAGATAAFRWVQLATSSSNGVTVTGQTLAISGRTVYVGGMATAPIVYGSFTLTNVASTTSSYVAALTDPDIVTAARPAAPLGSQVFPNPARGTATVRIGGAAAATVTLLDDLGRVVRPTSLVSGPEHQLNLRGLPAGVYLVRIVSTTTTTRHRLLVE